MQSLDVFFAVSQTISRTNSRVADDLRRHVADVKPFKCTVFIQVRNPDVR